MENTLIIALHGFLGLPSDWTQWYQKFGSKHQLWTPSLWTHPTLNSSYNLEEWTENFITEVIKLQVQGFNIELWGYSMGGRLALHALAHSPQLFHKAQILSSNPGLESQSEKELRLQSDLNWSHKFLTQEWDSLVSEWNQQPVLREPNNSPSLVQRNKQDYNRLCLAKSLENWSIGRQKNLWEFISIFKLPIEWHVGSHDTAYVNYGQRAAQLNSNIKLMIHEGRGHRLL